MQSEEDMSADARQILLSFRATAVTYNDMLDILQETGRESRYDVTIFDRYGSFLATSYTSEHPDSIPASHTISVLDRLVTGSSNDIEIINQKESDRIYVYGITTTSDNELYFIQISRLKSEIFKPVKTIRWIIYSGMFISIAIILFVSFIFSQYLSRPILQLTEASGKIADGDTNHRIRLNRNDEFGKLADSLNQMADRLRSDNEQLLLANEKQKQFYVDITHEIRNPLHTIMGTLEMLQMDQLSDDARKKYLKSALNQSERINRLFNDMMMLQRSDLDNHFIHKKPFDLSILTQRLQEAYQTLIAEKKLNFFVEVEPVRVLGDKDKIEQVLDNLISNAVKYTPNGSIRLSSEVAGNEVFIRLEDTGIGIAAEHIPRLFDRFYRTDKARSRDQGGTGLGLAVVKSILDAHGSTIQIESTPGVGTAISFSLPTA